MFIAILYFIAVGLCAFEGALFDIIVFDYYPQLYGCNYAFYALAFLMLICGIIDLVRWSKRRKRRKAVAGKTKNRIQPINSITTTTHRAAPKAKGKTQKRGKK